MLKKLTLLSAALTGAAALNAAVIANVAFDNTGASDAFTGAGAVGLAGDTWVAYDVANALEAIGAGISLQSAGSDYGDWYATGVQIGGAETITANYLYSSATLTLTLTGLSPASTYDITGIASLDGYFDGSAKTFQGVGANTVSSALTNNSAMTTFSNGVNYTTLVGVQPTAGGVITLTLDSDVGISALQISIPEPSTYAALAGALALGLVAWRRRR